MSAEDVSEALEFIFGWRSCDEIRKARTRRNETLILQIKRNRNASAKTFSAQVRVDFFFITSHLLVVCWRNDTARLIIMRALAYQKHFHI